MAKKADKKTKVPGGSYGAEAITVLEGLEPVRKRPGMYIGRGGVEGRHHFFWENFDYSRHQARGGFLKLM